MCASLARSRILFLFGVMGLLASPLHAQRRVSAPRSDGHSTPLLVYRAEAASESCAPLAVISHGAGGSEKGYRFLAEALAHDGYTTVVMGHRESGFDALRSDMRKRGIRRGISALVADPVAERDRLLDAGAALDWASRQCKPPFRVLLGHSMGSETVMLEAGARNAIGVSSPPAGQDRFDAYVALSPEGPGIVFPGHAWSNIHKPVLILTGTRDKALNGGWDTRAMPWRDLPGDPAGKCQWLGVIDGATHMNFAGNGIGADRVEPLVTQTISAFLSGSRQRSCSLPHPLPNLVLQAK